MEEPPLRQLRWREKTKYMCSRPINISLDTSLDIFKSKERLMETSKALYFNYRSSISSKTTLCYGLIPVNCGIWQLDGRSRFLLKFSFILFLFFPLPNHLIRFFMLIFSFIISFCHHFRKAEKTVKKVDTLFLTRLA